MSKLCLFSVIYTSRCKNYHACISFKNQWRSKGVWIKYIPRCSPHLLLNVSKLSIRNILNHLDILDQIRRSIHIPDPWWCPVQIQLYNWKSFASSFIIRNEICTSSLMMRSSGLECLDLQRCKKKFSFQLESNDMEYETHTQTLVMTKYVSR